MMDIEKDIIDNDYVVAYIEDGIFYCTYTAEYINTKEEAEKIVNDRLEFQKDYGVVPVIIEPGAIKKMSPEVKKYLGKEGTEGITCAAIIVDNLFASIIINTYLQFVNMFKTPTKTFTDKVKAREWVLKEHQRIMTKKG